MEKSTQQPFATAVDDELCTIFDASYETWREVHPDTCILDWLVRLPDDMYHLADEDTNRATWLTWVAFWDWFPFRSRLLVAETAAKKETAQLVQLVKGNGGIL